MEQTPQAAWLLVLFSVGAGLLVVAIVPQLLQFLENRQPYHFSTKPNPVGTEELRLGLDSEGRGMVEPQDYCSVEPGSGASIWEVHLGRASVKSTNNQGPEDLTTEEEVPRTSHRYNVRS